jgi:hypothetical protein
MAAMWWLALLLILIMAWVGWRAVQTAPQNNLYGSLGYGDLSALVPCLIDALAIILAITVLMIVFS